MCRVPRPAGCVHACEKKCHPKPCDPCAMAIKTACHCGLTQVYFKCNDLYTENQSEDELKKLQEISLSCGNRCIKNVRIPKCAFSKEKNKHQIFYISNWPSENSCLSKLS